MLPIRLRRVKGHDGRENDLLFHPPRLKPPEPETLVFFGGDVQDYEEVMLTHRDNKNYVKWSLENTTRMLSEHFPTKHIIVVRPARIEYKSFSCYDNFVPSNNAGVPEHTPTHSALHHLEKLLQEASVRIKELPIRQLCEAVLSVLYSDTDTEENNHKDMETANGSTNTDEAGSSEHKQCSHPLWWRDSLRLQTSRLSLAGFSKGCVVLNQLVYEFHYTNTLTPWDDRMNKFIERIDSMWWVDGGHAGGKNTWITARSLLETLARLKIEVHVHVSGYQVRDEARPWIAREETAFTHLLTHLGAKIDRHFHSDSSGPYSLATHFNVLASFKRVHDATDECLTSDDDS